MAKPWKAMRNNPLTITPQALLKPNPEIRASTIKWHLIHSTQPAMPQMPAGHAFSPNPKIPQKALASCKKAFASRRKALDPLSYTEIA